jgi:hypothetical protein
MGDYLLERNGGPPSRFRVDAPVQAAKPGSALQAPISRIVAACSGFDTIPGLS